MVIAEKMQQMEVLFLSPKSQWTNLLSSLGESIIGIQHTQLSAAPGVEAVIHICDGWQTYKVED